MVVILKPNTEKQQVTALLKAVESLGLKTNYSEGDDRRRPCGRHYTRGYRRAQGERNRGRCQADFRAL